MPDVLADAERFARRAAWVGALAVVGALILAVLGWAGGAIAAWMGVTARKRGAGRAAVVAIVLGLFGVVLGVANAVFGAYLFG